MSGRICLIVEDHPPIRTLLSSFLRRRGFQSFEAANASEALNIIQSLQGRLDLILTDILMPGDMNGVDLAHAARHRCPAIPVILMSGYGDDPNIRSFGFPLISKPFLPQTIWEMVEQVLALEGEASASAA
jgi:two-component system, NtrC family, sensor kinase